MAVSCSFYKLKVIPKSTHVSGENWLCSKQRWAKLQHLNWSFKCHNVDEKYSNPVKYDGSKDKLIL